MFDFRFNLVYVTNVINDYKMILITSISPVHDLASEWGFFIVLDVSTQKRELF